ncbi:sigma factor G inhibitor Gin [Jeotgalibacillus soli]|uniref:CsfB n=1 Tax=Jeotgalibacillus soli TaxID=889306 RepID=A0A0C2VU96_9BACL|nr:sigma factor G inhibitor Gin [Jeotgalibacillus soli]KIL52487.1 hypothetical protein KP78_00220 [Jeotgalibacillus soli]
MKVCQACRRRSKKGIRVFDKLICVWCEQALISLHAEDQAYDIWVRHLKN